MYRRLDSYHSILPDSFWIFSCVITKNSKTAVDLEITYKIVYRSIVVNLYNYKHYEYTACKFGEFCKITKSKLRDFMNNIIREKWEDVRVFNYNPIHFSLTIPSDLSQYPKRTLWEGVPDTKFDCMKAGKRISFK